MAANAAGVAFVAAPITPAAVVAAVVVAVVVLAAATAAEDCVAGYNVVSVVCSRSIEWTPMPTAPAINRDESASDPMVSYLPF